MSARTSACSLRLRKASMTSLSPCSNNCVRISAISAKIVWQFGFEFQPIFCDRMKKSEAPRMEHLPGKVANGFPIDLIPKDGVSDRLEMHPNLMGAASENLTQDERP